MSSKNHKKRRRIVTTSDVVPAGSGSRDDSQPETIQEPAATLGVEETSIPAELAPGDTAPAAVEVPSVLGPEGQKLVRYIPKRRGKKAPENDERATEAGERASEGEAAPSDDAEEREVEARDDDGDGGEDANADGENANGAAGGETAEDDASEASRAEEERGEEGEEVEDDEPPTQVDVRDIAALRQDGATDDDSNGSSASCS
jgi:hypothetical protein